MLISLNRFRSLTGLALLCSTLVAAPTWAAPTFAAGVSQGTISIPGLAEASGIVASRNNQDVLWSHNDSGDTNRIFALDTHGRKLGIYYLPGATNVDWEDIALGPGPVTNVLYLYVGDIGDNTPNRSNIKVYQVPEPAVYARQFANPLTANLKGVRAITLVYPDGPHNAEALFVDPWTGDLFIATKHNSVSGIYTATKAQLDTLNSIPLTLVRSVAFDVVSGGDISPTGTEIVLRQEDFAKLWTRAPGQTISNALAATPVSIPVVGRPTEPNGEAIGFDSYGGGYYTVSDSSATQPLYYFQRTSADGPKPPQTLVAAGSVWTYRDDGSDQGVAWRNPGFDDSAWPAGLGRFGYGNGDEQTVLSYGPDPNDKYITTYFRTTFVLQNAPCLANVTLKLLVTDGAAVFLNGAPAVYHQVNAGATFQTPAAAIQPANLEDTWLSFTVDRTLLVNGTNTLAVEVHQAAPNRPAMRFDLQMLATQSTSSSITSASFVNHRLELTLCGPANSNLTVEATSDLVNWSPIGSLFLSNSATVFPDLQSTNYDRRFYRLAK